MFQSCLICTDFTDGLNRLVNFVPSLASSGLNRIIFAHDVPLKEDRNIPKIDEQRIQEAKEQLSVALQHVPEGVEVKIEVTSGRSEEIIPRLVNNFKVDVVLVGTPIRNVLEEKLFGSTSMAIARETATPLMILRPQLVTTYTEEELFLRCQHLWRYLLIPYNDSQSARYLIEQIKKRAQNQAQNSLQQCMLVWVIEDGGRREIITAHRLQEAKEKLAAVKAELEQVGLQVNMEVRQGYVLPEILKAALVYDISAIAIATNYRKNPLEWTVSSCASDVLHRSWFPVLFFSPKKQ